MSNDLEKKIKYVLKNDNLPVHVHVHVDVDVRRIDNLIIDINSICS